MTSSDEDWDLLHDYQRAVAKEKINPLVCPHDETELYLRANKDFEPIFLCLFCETQHQIGLNTKNKLRKLLKEIPVD